MLLLLVLDSSSCLSLSCWDVMDLALAVALLLGCEKDPPRVNVIALVECLVVAVRATDGRRKDEQPRTKALLLDRRESRIGMMMDLISVKVMMR